MKNDVMINSTQINPSSEMDVNKVTDSNIKVWFKAARVQDFPKDGGACVKYKDLQIAVFNFTRRNEWYACQNLCPHKMQMVLSRGIIGSFEEIGRASCREECR